MQLSARDRAARNSRRSCSSDTFVCTRTALQREAQRSRRVFCFPFTSDYAHYEAREDRCVLQTQPYKPDCSSLLGRWEFATQCLSSAAHRLTLTARLSQAQLPASAHFVFCAATCSSSLQEEQRAASAALTPDTHTLLLFASAKPLCPSRDPVISAPQYGILPACSWVAL